MRKQETQLLIRWMVFMVALVVLAVVSWGVISESEAVYHITPEFQNMETTELKMINDAGETIEFKVRVADSSDERLAGFANIGAGVIRRNVVLLVYDRTTQTEIYMTDVPLALDLVYINTEGVVLEVTQTEARYDSPYTLSVPYRFVLEAPAGFFNQRNISNNGSVLDPNSLQSILPEPEPATN